MANKRPTLANKFSTFRVMKTSIATEPTTEEMRQALQTWLNDATEAQSLAFFYRYMKAASTPTNFDEEFKKGLTGEQFMAEMTKRIQAFPWKE
jgi:hypothetical protein